MYGARPLRRAIMKYLEDTLAEECLSQTLYPNTNILVRRKKVEGTLMSFLNELEVEIDFSEVDPNLLTSQDEKKSVNGTNNLESNTRFAKDQQEALAVAGAEFFANRR